ncbi:MAG: ribonuclease P protein component [Anaerolineae bacterium]
MGIKRAWRLKSQADVQRVWQQGGTWAHPLLVLRARANGLADTRVAFVVSKKVGNAVARNRAKRRMREVTRHAFPRIASGYDVVLIGRPPLVTAPFDQVAAALAAVLGRANLLK